MKTFKKETQDKNKEIMRSKYEKNIGSDDY